MGKLELLQPPEQTNLTSLPWAWKLEGLHWLLKGMAGLLDHFDLLEDGEEL